MTHAEQSVRCLEVDEEVFLGHQCGDSFNDSPDFIAPVSILKASINSQVGRSMCELQVTLCYLGAMSSCTQEWLLAFTHANADKSLRLAAKRPQEKAINDGTNVNKIEECDGGDTIE